MFEGGKDENRQKKWRVLWLLTKMKEVKVGREISVLMPIHVENYNVRDGI